jgi:TPR repeat protein
MIRQFASVLVAAGLLVVGGGSAEPPARAQTSASAQEIAKDYDKAFRLLKFGCDFGSLESCSNLGFMYDLGRPEAEYAVGFMLAYGQGTARNYLEAAQFLGKAAERGIRLRKIG